MSAIKRLPLNAFNPIMSSTSQQQEIILPYAWYPAYAIRAIFHVRFFYPLELYFTVLPNQQDWIHQ